MGHLVTVGPNAIMIERKLIFTHSKFGGQWHCSVWSLVIRSNCFGIYHKSVFQLDAKKKTNRKMVSAEVKWVVSRLRGLHAPF
jgi:hypothetical protein